MRFVVSYPFFNIRAMTSYLCIYTYVHLFCSHLKIIALYTLQNMFLYFEWVSFCECIFYQLIVNVCVDPTEKHVYVIYRV